MRKKNLGNYQCQPCVWPKDLVDSDKSVPQKVSHFFNIFGHHPSKISPPSWPEWQRSSSSWRQLITWWLRRSREKKRGNPPTLRWVLGWVIAVFDGVAVKRQFFCFCFSPAFDKIRKKLQRLPSWLIYFFRWATMVIYSPTNFHASQSYKSRKTFTNSSCKPDF